MRFLAPADLASIDARSLDDVLTARECVIAVGEGELRGLAAAALLFADYAVLRTGAIIIIDTPEAAAAAVWRGTPWSPQPDEITDHDPETWRANWLKGRSTLALDSAATLIRSRGGDALERAEFARLFGTGEPQTGLGAFLTKQPPTFR